jgi:IS30 family transposase
MADGLLTTLRRVETLAREINERERELDAAIRRARDQGASMRQIGSWAGRSAATISRRLRPTPEETEELVDRQAEMARTRLQLAKVRLARAALAARQEIDPDELGDVDAVIEEGLRIVDDLDLM